jgi:drug/metabolite transporter (DMT)-like permease
MLLATFYFALMNVFVKQLSHIPAMEVVFFRCLVSFAICSVGLYQKQIDWRGSSRLRLFLRGAFGTTALYCYFVTVQNIPLASAVTIQHLSPVFTAAIAVFLLGEKVRPLHWLFFALSFAGVFVIRGFDERVSTVFLFTGIGAALFSALAYNMVRSLKEKEQPLVIVLHFQIVGVAAGLLFTLFDWKIPGVWDWVYLLATGLATHMGQIHLTKSLQAENVARVSILGYLGIVYAIFFGYFVFGEELNLQTVAGIALIAGGVIASMIYSRRHPAIDSALDK